MAAWAADPGSPARREAFLDALVEETQPWWDEYNRRWTDRVAQEEKAFRDWTLDQEARLEKATKAAAARDAKLLSLAERVELIATSGFLGSKKDLALALGWPGSVASLNAAIRRISGELHERRIYLRETGNRTGPTRLAEWEAGYEE